MNSREVFFLEPANADFHQNRTRLPVRPRSWELLVLIAFGFVGTVPGWIAWDEWREIKRLAGAQIAEAQLVRARDSMSSDDDDYHLEYRLALPGGVTLQRDQEVTRSDYERLRRRETLEVLYNSDGESRIRDTEPTHGMLAVGFSGFWVLISCALVWAQAAKRNKAYRLARAPRVRGRIRDVSGSLDEGTYTVKVVYELESPKTKRLLTGTQSATRNDLKDGRLPERGREVLVLYGADDDCLLL